MNRSELIKTLNVVKPAIATKDFIPSFTCYCFTSSQVQAFNNVIAIRTPLKTDFTGLVNGKLLAGLLNASTSEKAELKANKTNLELKMGRTNAKCPLISIDEFLFEWPDLDEEAESYSTNKEFFVALEKAMVSTVSDNTLPNFMGVLLEAGEEKDILWSTNNASITKVEIDSTFGVSFKCPLPAEFCEVLLSHMSKDNYPLICFDDNYVCAIFEDNTEIIGKIFNDEIPDYEQVTSMVLNNEYKPVPLPKTINNALARAKVVADIAHCHTKIIIKDDKFTLLTESPAGVVKDTEKLKRTHPNITKLVDAKRFSEVINYSDDIYVTEECVALQKEQPHEKYLHLLSNIVDI